MSDPSSKPQIIFMATGGFAVPSMRRLWKSGEFEISGLVTMPQKFTKSGEPILTPARQFADEVGLHVFETDNIHASELFDFLYLARPDHLFVCDFGKILPKSLLRAPRIGGINLHGSLLPKYRGAAPVHWAILNGDEFSGVSIIQMTTQVDAGPVIAQSPPIPIGPHETCAELEGRLADFGAELVLRTIRKLSGSENVRIIPQLASEVSKAPKIKKEDGRLDWKRSSSALFNHYRAMDPWPRSYTDWKRDNGIVLRLIVGPVLPLDDHLHELVEPPDYAGPNYLSPVLTDAKWDNLAEIRQAIKKKESEKAKPKHSIYRRPTSWKPGVVIEASGDRLIVAAGEGAVRILQIQPAGKRPMDVEAFLRGYPLKSGDRFE